MLLAVGCFGLSNGTRIQIYGDWLNDRLLVPSTVSYPLPSSVNNGEIASSCCLYCSSIMVLIRHSFLDSPPLYEHVAGQALRLSIAGCQIADPLHFEVHLIFVPGGSPQYGFF